MTKLLINRINLKFNKEAECYLNISKPINFSLVGSSILWAKGKLPPEYLKQFEDWLEDKEIKSEDDFVCFDFSEKQRHDCFSLQLSASTTQPFKSKIFLQEMGTFFIESGFYVEPSRMAVDFSAYQRMEDFNPEWEQYRRIDFKWNREREELSFNIGSDKTLISRQRQAAINGTRIVNEQNQLVYKTYDDDMPRKIFNVDYIDKGIPTKFNYNGRYEDLKKIAFEYLNIFQSKFFRTVIGTYINI